MHRRIAPLRLITMCLACMVISSCMEDIDLDTGERILSVYCVLGPGPSQELELSYIAPTGKESKSVEGDTVINLYDEDEGVLCGQFSRVSETTWLLDYYPQTRHAYRLEVLVPGEKELSAETRYPPVAELKCVSVDVHIGDPNWELGIGYELGSDEDQLLWCYFEDINTDPVTMHDFVVTDHPGVDGRGETQYPFDWDSDLLPDNFSTCSNSIYSQTFYGKPSFLHEKVVRIVHPAGFSRALDENKIKVTSPFPTREDIPNHVEEEIGRSSMFGLSFVSKRELKKFMADLVICSVSEEYDKYLADYYYSNSDPDDFTSIVYKKNQYSNIVNGTGIFGASHSYRQEVQSNGGLIIYGYYSY